MLETIELIISLIMVWFAVFKLSNYIIKNRKVIYITVAVICTGVFALMLLHNIYYTALPENFYYSWFLMPFRLFAGGFLGAAIWAFVMVASVCPNKKVRDKMMRTRTELSVLGFMISMPQAIEYTVGVLLRGLTSTPSLYIGSFMLAFTIMLTVLGVTSFDNIKHKIGMKKWKKLHKLSHVFYFILFLELTLLSFAFTMSSGIATLDGIGCLLRTIIYATIYICNIVFRVRSKKLKKCVATV